MTPRTTPLTRDEILTAALTLIDTSGPEAISMRKLTETLSVKAMTLHHRSPNKDAILDGVVARVFGEMRMPEPLPEGWMALTEEMFVAFRREFGRALHDPCPDEHRHDDAEHGHTLGREENREEVPDWTSPLRTSAVATIQTIPMNASGYGTMITGNSGPSAHRRPHTSGTGTPGSRVCPPRTAARGAISSHRSFVAEAPGQNRSNSCSIPDGASPTSGTERAS